jgi:hypothetical protein
MMPTPQPWSTGPHEILHHAISLLKNDSDTNRRLAMILVDNAVEQMIKTYLNLPKRISGLSVPRAKREQIAESFPAMLDALEDFAADKLVGVDLGNIEWYHRLRNQLYHEGFGLTVARVNVEVYAELANALFKNLFGFALPATAPLGTNDRLAELIQLWNMLESGLIELASRHSLLGVRRTPIDAMRLLNGAALIEDDELEELFELRQIRNAVVHGQDDHRKLLTDDVMTRLRYYTERYREDEDTKSA